MQNSATLLLVVSVEKFEWYRMHSGPRILSTIWARNQLRRAHRRSQDQRLRSEYSSRSSMRLPMMPKAQPMPRLGLM